METKNAWETKCFYFLFMFFTMRTEKITRVEPAKKRPKNIVP